jgi:hypothetical protein
LQRFCKFAGAPLLGLEQTAALSLSAPQAGLSTKPDASLDRARDHGVVVRFGSGRGLVPGALDLLGADHAVARQAQEDRGCASTPCLAQWHYHITQHAIVARCGLVEIRTTGDALDEVWEFASEIERAADELIIPLIGAETGARPLTN